MQSIGRDRGVNRTAETPLTRVIVTDVVLPITVDQVQGWQPPGLEIEMAAAGIWLESPADMAKAWPEDWATPQAAKNWLQACKGHTVLFPLRDSYSKGKKYRVKYQHPGARQKWRFAWVDPAVVPDPRKWLEARLGPIAGFEVIGAEARLPWSTPVVEEIFVTPKERAALDRLPAILDGGPLNEVRAA